MTARFIPLAASLATGIAVFGCTTPSHHKPATVKLTDKGFTSFDGKDLPFTHWLPENQAPGSVVIAVHGLSGAASDFWRLGEGLPKHGVAVYAPELRGQGNDPDPGRDGDIPSRDTWFRDLVGFSRLVSARHPDATVIWYGESLGSLITLQTATRKNLDPADLPSGLILASPVVDFRNPIPPWKRMLVRLTSRILPRKRLSLEDLGDTDDIHAHVTGNTTHASQMKITPHYVKTFTLRLLRETDSMVAQSTSRARTLNLPTLVLYTPNDIFSSQSQVESFFNEIASTDKEKQFFPKSYHLILHDVEAGRAVDIVRAWIENHGAGRRVNTPSPK